MRNLSQLSITGILLLPVIIVFSHILAPSTPNWEHLVEYRLFGYIKNTLLLMLGSGLLSFIFGSSAAYLTTIYKFPLSRFLEWALVLPLAYPAYIAAYMYGGILGVEGSFTAWVSKTFNISYQNLWFLDIMSLPGAIFIIASVLYPYVYLSMKASLKQMSQSNIDAAKVYGYSPMAIFFKIILPSQRLAISAGVILVMMEAMSDYGAVSYLGVSTFVAGIFRTWFGLGDLAQATKLASMLMLFVFILLFVENYQRKGKNYSALSKGFKPIEKTTLKGPYALLATFICFIPFIAGFILPTAKMLQWFLLSYKDVMDEEYLSLCINTFKLAFYASISTTILGFLMVYLTRFFKTKLSKVFLQISKLGYAVPGAVIGVGILTFFGFLRQLSSPLNLEYLFVGGGIMALIYGYTIRFLAVSASSFENGYNQINKNYQDAAKTLGYGRFEILKKIDLPLLKSTYGICFIIVFVEILKELPLTLILRPFNYETLSTRALELTTQEMIVQCSVPSMSIMLLSLIPVFLLIKTTLR